MAERGLSSQPDEELLDLLVEQVTAGLSVEQSGALEVLDAVASDYLQGFERAAAAVDLAASLRNQEPLPAVLRARIEYEARSFFGKDTVSRLKALRQGRPVSTPPLTRTSTAGWLAAAACLLLALLGWLRPSKPPTTPHTVSTHTTFPQRATPPVRIVRPPSAPRVPTPAEERTALLAQSGTVILNLAATKDPNAVGVIADVVWDPTSQRGFMHIVGLKPNDPRSQQYQAWIFDAQRDKRYPLAAGLFDAPGDSTDIVVPIHSDLPVHTANAFAVTLEQSGGVVVPALRHVIVLGKVS